MKHLNLLGKGTAKIFALTLLILASFSFSAVAQQKVVGGVDVDIKDYPWQVALTSSPTGSGFCGGSIIGDSWVLTAAHCVNGDSPSNLYIRVGSSDPFASGGDSYSVNQIIVHPSYSGNSYDFALVEIDGAFAFSTYVDAIDLVSPADIAAGVQDGGVMATITGWGTTSSGGSLSSTLQMVEAPIVENNVACGSSTDSNGNSGDYSCSSLDETMICAGDLIDGGEDACQGDSGGPLAVRNAANTKWLLIGATSWGYGCADVNYPGVWSKVSYVLDWITSNADVTSQICADETACNYTYDATGEAEVNNALCIYEIDECGDCGGDGPTPGYDCDGNCVTGETLNISMSDSYGDGWNGNNLVVNGVASTLSSGSSGSTTLCYDSSAGCVDVSCDGGSWQSEVSWIISDENGNQLLAGGAPFTGAFGGADCGPAVPGCTDDSALNYNANATEDDGSCQYPIDCEGLTAVMIEVGGGSWQTEVSWSIAGFEGIVGSTEACLEDGCHTFNMYDSYGDGWNGNTVTIFAGSDILATGTLESGSEGTLSFGLNFEGECGPVYGCTDSLALNFDIEATSNDGSCIYPVLGCTDSLALNYDSAAVEDDGSCIYPMDCEGLMAVMIEVGGGSYDYEISWELNGLEGEVGTTESCLEEGCYTFNMYDSWGDGWNGATVSITTATGESLISGTLEAGTSGTLLFSYNEDCGYVSGCMDPAATNYNSEAILDDGSCEYPVFGCTDESAINYNADATDDDGSCYYDSDVLGCNDELALNFDPLATYNDGSCEYPFSCEEGYILDCDGSGECHPAAWIGDGFADCEDQAWGADLSCYDNDGGDCGDVVVDSLGCTDPNASNYDPNAIEDDGSCEYPIDCEGLTSVVIQVGGGSWVSEVSWTVGSFAGGEGSVDACLEDGCHTFNMYDSYGDGWNGNTVTITSANGDVLLTGTLESGSEGSLGFGLNTAEDCGEVVGPILGCTDAAAINYNPEATEDDGSCQYDSNCDLNTVMMTMNDSYGDGWNGNVYVISDGSGAVVAEGTLNEGSNGTDELCLDADCYTMTVGGGSWSSEVSWSISLLSDDIMEIVAEGSAGEDFSFAINSECEGGSDVYGCTDATATNYNPEATEDDGSCEYDSSCSGLDALVTISTGSFAYEMEWSLEDAAGNQIAGEGGSYENYAVYEIAVCLESGTDYNFNMADSYGDGWNGGTFSVSAECGEIAAGGLETGESGQVSFNASCEGGSDDTPWDVIITGSNHTIVVDGEAIIDLDGMPIEIGDALGVFFTDDNGVLQCAGYVTWTGSTNSIAAQGDDSTTDEIDGFVSGSEFVWIVWDASEGVELMATANYSDAMPNQESFVVNGISALAGLATAPPISEQLISMPEGWSMFSTYMLATDMDMQNMLSPIVDDVVIAKNNEGLAYLPEWGFNGVGDLQVGQGYQIKLLATNEITVVGEYMLPEENPIALTAGWNMIGYLRLEGADAASILAGITATDNLVIAKDYNGSAYLPEWDFNGIGDMLPGQGYQLKINNDDVLLYNSNDESYRMSSTEVTLNNVSHFSKVVATDNNMTVVIEDAAWDVLPTEGSEVAAFDAAGTLIGSAIYSSPVTVVTVWGDDALTSAKEGSIVSEVVSFKVYTSGDVRDFTVTEWAEGSSTYNVDAINVASSIEINTVVADAISSDRVLVKVINVLGQEVQLNDESFKGEILFNVYDDGSVEQFVK